jgi:hypothetical protein
MKRAIAANAYAYKNVHTSGNMLLNSGPMSGMDAFSCARNFWFSSLPAMYDSVRQCCES